MISRRSFALVIMTAICTVASCSAQCSVPEVVEYPAPYNGLVCDADAATKRGDNKLALDLLLKAAKTPLLEAPNVLLFGRIALAYAKLSLFKEADQYLRYDELTLFWRIGIVRCETIEHSDDEVLYRDGHLLNSDDATHMANELCGDAYRDLFDFQNDGIESFIPVAKAILRHDTIRQEIALMRAKQLRPNH